MCVSGDYPSRLNGGRLCNIPFIKRALASPSVKRGSPALVCGRRVALALDALLECEGLLEPMVATADADVGGNECLHSLQCP